jgi:glyoxylase-like metal-dependent hydrolase (beta-lactamase superfamily II)
MTSHFQRLDHGISVVDTDFGRPRFDASYLIIHAGRAAFIDTGPNSAVPRLLSALEQHGLTCEAVDWVIPTHVHLDHAGGAGALMRELPNARLAVHPRGARHMVDPTQLLEGVRAVYGADVAARDYGELVPVPQERVVPTADQMTLDLAGRPLRIVHTPGHAKHHHCIWDEASRGWFTGDTFGIVYPELAPYIVPATAPVQFEPRALHASVTRLLAAHPARMYLTHYGAVSDAAQLSVQLLRQVDAMVSAARELAGAPDRHARLRDACAQIYLSELSQMSSTLTPSAQRSLLELDVELNAQGLGAWLDTTRSQAAPGSGSR